MRSVIHRAAAWIKKTFTARRSAACEQENEKPAKCKHEWEKTDGGSTDFTADHSAVIYTTIIKCKLCGEEGVIEHADYH